MDKFKMIKTLVDLVEKSRYFLKNSDTKEAKKFIKQVKEKTFNSIFKESTNNELINEYSYWQSINIDSSSIRHDLDRTAYLATVTMTDLLNENIDKINYNYICIALYQHLFDIEMIAPQDASYITITGNNGEGKTTFLQAIALAGAFLKEESIVVTTAFRGGWRTSAMTITGGNNRLLAVAYGTARLQMMGAQSQHKEENFQSFIYSLFHDDGKLLNIGYWLSRPSRAKYRAEVARVLGALLPTAKPQYDEEEQDFIFTEGTRKVSSSQLSAGNKSILAMVGDMIIRLWQQQPEVEKISDLEGVVLIDEMETHLHPSWQLKFPSLLHEIFPKVLFIVTTHSPMIILGMPEKSVFYNVYTEEEKTKIERVDIDVANLLPNHILTSPLFDLNDIRSVQNKDAGDTQTEKTFSDIAKREELLQRMRELAKNEDTQKRLRDLAEKLKK